MSAGFERFLCLHGVIVDGKAAKLKPIVLPSLAWENDGTSGAVDTEPVDEQRASSRKSKETGAEEYEDVGYIKLPPTSQEFVKRQGDSLTCMACGKVFERRSNLNKHIRHVHANERLYQCKKCGNRFGQKSSIDKHVRTIHGMKLGSDITKRSSSHSEKSIITPLDHLRAVSLPKAQNQTPTNRIR
mmetsp:Transcript_11644/g.25183  ORF Transcript_11644/g.25183 Transcript_11644/m.25183 type:complete len:186 (-) Transcript_11644:69-626(-)